MRTTSDFIDAVRVKLALSSDNQLAAYWKVTRQRISEYRRGATAFSDDRCIEVAEILGIDPGEVILAIHAERARKCARPAVAAVFDSLLRKLGPTAAALVVIFLGMPAPADAAPMPFGESALIRQHLTDNANYQKYTLLHRLICIKIGAAISLIFRPFLSPACSGFYYKLS